MMWLIAFGSAIHKRSSCTHAQVVSVRVRMRDSGARSVKRDTYPKRAVPADDVPELLEEPLVRRSSLSGLEIPLVS